jgi:peptidoglycan/xylan/chitin deacetylase (PgdA/CDA1 family)
MIDISILPVCDDMSLLIAGSCLATVSVAYGASWFAEIRGIHDWLVPIAMWRNPGPEKVLTFDDGPDPEKTPRLLDVLAAAQAKAVFFVTGEKAEKYPHLVSRIQQEGHRLGNHSWSHPWLVFKRYKTVEEEILRCQQVLTDITGQSPSLARPPYGQKDFRYYQILKKHNLLPVLWSRNIRDYWGSSVDVITQRLNQAKPGDILLLHDGDAKAKNTIPAVAKWLQTRPDVGLL